MVNQEYFIARVEANDLDAVSILLESGANVHARDDHALKWSAERGRLRMVLKLLEYGASLHATNDYALRWSARNGYLDVVTKLLELGADPNANYKESSDAKSPLIASVNYNHLNVVIKLLEYNVNLHIHDDYALQLSILRCNFEITKVLLEHGANIYCADKKILVQLKINFCENVANIVLPYCNIDDYEYFPRDYIKRKIIPTKSANKKID